jgi:predicted nucleotidyltransferase
LKEARRLVEEALAGQGVRAFLFGSRARGDARPFSDLDIALDSGGEPVPRGLVALLAERLEDSCIPYRVDLVDLALVPKAWQQTILEEGTPWNG